MRRIVCLSKIVLCFFVLSFSFSFAAWHDAAPVTTDILISVDFYDSAVGFAVGDGGALMKTSDGGNSWSLSSTGTTDAFILVAATGSDEYVALSQNRIIYKRWNGVTLPVKDYSAEFSSFYNLYYNKDLNKIILVGGADISSMNPCNLAESADRGSTWSEQLIGSLESYYFDAWNFVYDGDSMFLFGSRGGSGGWLFQEIYKSSNAGVFWSRMFKQFVFAQSISGACAYDNCFWFATLTGRIYRSIDAGLTWQSTAANVGTGIPYTIKFASKKVGWLTSITIDLSSDKAGIFRTVDGGITWSLVKPGLYTRFSLFSNPTKLIAVGSAGAISILEPPTVSSLSKTQLLQGTTETISIFGTGFESAESISGIVNPIFQFNKSGISIESVNVVSSTEISVVVRIDSDAELGQVDMTLTNVDTTVTSEVNAFSVGAGTSGMTVSSIVPASGVAGSSNLDITINGSNILNPGTTGSMEISLGTGILVKSITWLNSSQVSAKISIEATAIAGIRNLSVLVKGPTGETIATATKSAAFTVEELPDPGSLPNSTDILPAVGASGVWNPERDGNLTVQVKAPVAGSYDIMVATPAGIKYKKATNLSVGYNKIVIPSNLELTNGTHVLMLQDPRTGKLVKAKIVVLR